LSFVVEFISLSSYRQFDSLESDADRKLVYIVNPTTYDLNSLAKTTEAHVWRDDTRTTVLKKSKYQGLARSDQDLLDDVAMRQKCQGHSGRSIIWVAEGSAASAVSRALRQADWGWNGRSDTHRSVLESTYGIVRLQSHHRIFLKSWMLAIGQASSYWFLHNYEISRDSTTHTAGMSFLYTRILRSPSTGVFVICALLYSVFAMLQYHINRADYFQKLCLVTGLTAAILLSPAIPFSVPESSVSVHIFAATTSVALVCSACGHWVWRTFFSTREARLEKKLAEWGKDAGNLERSTYVIKFCELA